jgi:hypothetical protein
MAMTQWEAPDDRGFWLLGFGVSMPRGLEQFSNRGAQ